MMTLKEVREELNNKDRSALRDYLGEPLVQHRIANDLWSILSEEERDTITEALSTGVGPHILLAKFQSLLNLFEERQWDILFGRWNQTKLQLFRIGLKKQLEWAQAIQASSDAPLKKFL